MWDLLVAGGWLMLPIIICSIVALAVVMERLWSLRTRHVVPRGLVNTTWQQFRANELDHAATMTMRHGSYLGRVLATCVSNQHHGYAYIKQQMEETGKQVAHDLGRYLEVLATIASIAPLLGLLGTVVGMIEVFYIINIAGIGDTSELAGGISKALITTASGLVVAIPTVVVARYFRARVEAQVVTLESEAQRFLSAFEEYRQANAGARG